MPETNGQTRQASPHDVDLVELRVGLAGLTAEVQRMRADVAPLAGLPLQLQAVADLQAERLTNHIERHQRDIDDLREDITHAERRAREAIKTLEDWQTWAMRLVVGAVIVAVLAAVGLSGP